ncbi:hypothetical protein [Campylobacter troglodytis]|uniref:hypothetical protein n=1 Tax=Campylobacter troglodytis TaxID=654363 RepID=UPI00163BC28A|nr:hypothetical protein [Campylobacter troglodytis]
MLIISASAYYVGGEYAALQKCSYEQYDNEYCNVWTYKGISGKTYQMYFGSKYCEY